MWPQITMLVVALITLLFGAHLHGTSKGKYNFWVIAISVALELFILYSGGFFNVFK